MANGGMTPPGWYPDPYYAGSTRYWDGNGWTAHAQSTGYAQVGAGGDVFDLAAGRTAADRAAKTFVVQGFTSAIGALAYPVYFSSFFDQLRDLNEGSRFGTTPNGFGTSTLLSGAVLQLVSIVGFVALVFVIIWCHRATSNTRALGLLTTHSPGWAVAGWLVPVVNFWFPYQIVRDLLPESDPMRARVGMWWGLYIGGTLMAFVPAIVAFFSLPTALAVALIPAAMYVSAGYLSRRIALAVADAHEAAAATAGSGFNPG